MDWEQKLLALQALAEYPENVTIRMRHPGDWYCSVSGVEVRNGGCLESKYGDGKTPQEAVENCFLVLTDLPVDQYLVRNAMSREKRKYFLWNGFMWSERRREESITLSPEAQKEYDKSTF